MISPKGGLHLRVSNQRLVSRHSLVPDPLDAADTLQSTIDTNGVATVTGLVLREAGNQRRSTF